ncbi:type IVB secretion system protein IcmH/DotU [Campylobacter sp. MIT 21-1685]|uniref:type IVB secretion system protein IcmH/DotU n=1 Tax=unclassified Campylobacter TaxID=2593542 RepID=UPI00224A4CA4|nr:MULTISPECIES: type IVB secretion system protein IcmH/DotU [unclassified Campylobacter]MCX2683778.1 type IVB secretion system protein IcmH/DotU [Campylobacter sp. MIT 21-1684]MCX2752062.1 type IVB secretion system protein IcmH/DotU [Campylobacter sp. MIT 21-1682]MCX2808265.1 type IVB secretion system protein IcmH/DotU [Campylobacter sp. MIT 21-1685]
MQKQSNTETQEFSLLLSSDLSGLKNNKVVDYCLELLLLSFRLSKVSLLDTSAIESLREKIVNDILTWSSKLSALKEYDEKDIIRLRYCLCVFIDEMLMKNELFINSSWANNTLTVRLFDETLGGDNFYDITSSWLNNPAKNKDFLEFIYACLVFGYKGKYSNNKDVEERILFFCNNIASSLTPLYDVGEELAFTKAYNGITKEGFWQNFQRVYLKKILISLPLCIIVGVFVYVVFDLEVNNIRIQNNVNEIIKSR